MSINCDFSDSLSSESMLRGEVGFIIAYISDDYYISRSPSPTRTSVEKTHYNPPFACLVLGERAPANGRQQCHCSLPSICQEMKRDVLRRRLIRSFLHGVGQSGTRHMQENLLAGFESSGFNFLVNFVQERNCMAEHGGAAEERSDVVGIHQLLKRRTLFDRTVHMLLHGEVAPA